MKDKERVMSVEKAMSLLFAFRHNKRRMTIQDFVSHTGYSRPTLYRLLNSLMVTGMISKDHEGFYHLGTPILQLSSIIHEDLDIRKSARPDMEALFNQTGETITLNILENGSRVCIEKIDSRNLIRQEVIIGKAYPLDRGATGKVLLAYTTEHAVIDSKSENDSNLNTIRKNGYAHSSNERLDGVFSFSAPLFDSGNHLSGCLSLSGLSSNLTEEKIMTYPRHLKQAANSVTEKLGGSIIL
ncbi:IclR family transcriptional regulator [Bhargavaea ginsengi]|uniref:IclR family transcriptional regulator n=1 Tax=Bhargavaea ginsengi TaxID=426757 RepID=UPI003C76F996